jgi:hypothetical protein
MTPRFLSIALGAGCAAVSAIAIGWSADSLALAGSTPATIWGPDVAPLTVVALVVAPLVAVVATRKRAQAGGLIIWFVVLAVLTHRVVDRGVDGLDDVWLGIPIVTIAGLAETDPAPRRCRLARLPALCITRNGTSRRLPTGVAFVALAESPSGLVPPAAVARR